MNKTLLFLLVLLLPLPTLQSQIKIGEGIFLSGSLQSENLMENKDSGSGVHIMDNSYLNLNLTSKNIYAGIRLDFTEWPLPGYEVDFKGWGLGNIFLTWKYKKLDVTAGSIYDQFGSGLLFRSYEERSLGIDNSLIGGRICYQPYKGIALKVLGGKQKRYHEYNDGFVAGADAEFSFDQWITNLSENNTFWSVGTSWITKYEPDENIMFIDKEAEWFKRLNLPKYVAAFEIRSKLQTKSVCILAEYAQKANDPSKDNGYIYRKGQVVLFSLTYSKRGMTGMLQAKRSDNMSFRSKRSELGISSFINHLPAFTQQHTYALATIYPYATQPEGEWAFQGELSYNFNRGTALGGKYGTKVRMNASHIRSIDKRNIPNSGYIEADEYSSDFFKWGDVTYYQDINIDVDKRITRDFKLNLMYLNQHYNPVVVGHVDEGMIANHIFVAEGKYQVSKKVTLRAEAQYLSASDYIGDENIDVHERSNQGGWVFALLELSFASGWMFAVQDHYNSGATKQHYYMFSGVWNYKSHRIELGYGRTREGYDCSGGVCRMVPETNGLRVNYNFTF